MANTKTPTYIAYRCPECGSVIFGLVGEFALDCKMLRLKCDCGGSSLDFSTTADKKIKLSVPCVLCKENHSYVISPSVFFGRDVFSFNCPYANLDIAFVGSKERIDELAKKSEDELRRIITGLGAEELSDIQPVDMDDDEILAEPEAYDIIRFVLKNLEDEGRADCPCHSGCYDLRYAPGGIQIFCPECQATKFLPCHTATGAEQYVDLDSIILT